MALLIGLESFFLCPPKGIHMEKFTSVAEVEADGLYWYYENGVDAPRPVMITKAKWGNRFKSFNGSEQSWLRDGEYLVGPQPTPDAQ